MADRYLSAFVVQQLKYMLPTFRGGRWATMVYQLGFLASQEILAGARPIVAIGTFGAAGAAYF